MDCYCDYDEPWKVYAKTERKARKVHRALTTEGMMKEFYVISLNHTNRRDRYILLWRPDDKGYTFRTSTAGKYSEERIRAHLGYYNSGCAAMAVPVEVVDAMTVMTTPRDCFDGPDGPAVLATGANWKKLIETAIESPQYKPEPEYKGARRRAEV